MLVLVFSYLLRLWLHIVTFSTSLPKAQRNHTHLYLDSSILQPESSSIFLKSNFFLAWEFYAVEFPLTLRGSLLQKHIVKPLIFLMLLNLLRRYLAN